MISRTYRRLSICLVSIGLLLAHAVQAQDSRYANEEVGVKLSFNEEWQLFTSRETAPEVLKATFPENKGKNDSPLMIGVHKSQQLFARLLVEPAAIRDLETYARLMGTQLASQNLAVSSAKYAPGAGAVELEYRQDQAGMIFRERVALVNDQYLLRLGFWTYKAAYDKYSPQINELFSQVQLLDAEQNWVNNWAGLEAKLPDAHIEGIQLAAADPVASAELKCKDPSSSLLWKAEGENSTVHMFGSIHFGKAEFYPLADKIEAALKNADHVVFEIDPGFGQDPEVVADLQRQGMFSQGESLKDVVSPALVTRLEETLGGMGLPADNFLRMRPWFLNIALTGLLTTSLGYIPDYGVERYVLENKPADAEVLELETLEQQLEFFKGLDGEAYLAYTLLGFEAAKQKFPLMADAWRCADKARLERMFREEFDAASTYGVDPEGFEEALLDNRNEGMADKIKDYLDEGEGNYFVVVGAGHYLGDNSIVELLRDEGYKVDAVSL